MNSVKKEAIKDYLIINGEIKKVEDIDIFKKITKPPIYEVIRVIEGVPIFLEEHIERLKKSSQFTNYSINRAEEEIKEDIKNVILKNNVENLNIKLLIAEIDGKGDVFLIYFVESYYPEPILYEEGIHTILYHHERENPNAKLLNTNFKEKIKKRLEKDHVFEALLVNEDGCITEGSRSNIFFIKNDSVFTAPGEEVLLGITRKQILEVCSELNIKVVERNIYLEDLGEIDGAFMTGTSVNVLPITTIGKKKLDSVNNDIIKGIADGYLKKIKDYSISQRLFYYI